jgi:Rnl2 family RNA ligase
MKFKKFCEIENHYREKYIAILREHGFSKIKWHVSEKIDGANFQFITNGKEVRVASRNQFVDQTFYNCSEVIERYTDKVLRLKQEHFPDAEQVSVYGEMFGRGIQNKVFYTDGKDFMAFEVQVDGKVLDTDWTARYLALVEIPMTPSFGVFDDLDEALAFSNEFNSKVVDILHPDSVCEYDPGENLAEGLVLKPVEPVYTSNGSRVIIKNKNEKFSEKSKKKNKTPSEPNPFIPVVEQYVNENRMNAVISKEGELTPKDFGRIIKLMGEDVIKDMIKDEDLPEDWKKQDEFKDAGKAVSTVVAKFLKINLLATL